MPSTLFEEMGFHYSGPVDGNDINALVKSLRTMRTLKGPQLLHVITTKGKGYDLAEDDQIEYHAVSPFDPNIGIVKKNTPSKPTYTQIFGDWLCDMAAVDEKCLGITPAMREGSGMVEFHKRFPERYFDVGIAEQHAVTFAAGLACEGLKPVLAIYSTFLQRGYDQLIHDVAIQNLPVVLALDRAGIVGADGATHAGVFDIPYLRCVPNLAVLTPADEDECRKALTTAFRRDQPVAVRYPRGAGVGKAVEPGFAELPWGKGELRRSTTLQPGQGRRVAILAFGTLLYPALTAAQALDTTVANMRFAKPLDAELVLELARSHDALVTVEEGAVMGGAGSAVLECIAAAGLAVPVLLLGVPDQFTEHGDPAKLMTQLGLDAAGIEASVRKRFGPTLQLVKPAAVND